LASVKVIEFIFIHVYLQIEKAKPQFCISLVLARMKREDSSGMKELRVYAG
jgi:hypothetical protein